MPTTMLKAARLSDSSVGSSIDNALGDLETALSLLLGMTLDAATPYPLAFGASGAAGEYAQITDSAVLASFTSAEFSKTRTLDAGVLSSVGKSCRIRAAGTWDDTLQPVDYDFTPYIKLGSTKVFQTGAIPMHYEGAPSGPGQWTLDAEIVTRVAGASGVVYAPGGVMIDIPAGATFNYRSLGLNDLDGVVVNLTGTLVVSIGIAHTAGSSANRKATMRSFTIELLQAANTS